MRSKELKTVDPAAFERVPPHNLEAEQSLLGAMLLSADATANVVEKIRPEDFYREAHRSVFEAITKLYMSGEPADPIMVAEELDKMGVLERVGGKLFIHTLVNYVPTAANAHFYADILQRHSLLRGLIRAATDIAAIGYEAPENLEAALDRAESIMFNVSKQRISEKFSVLEQLLTENWELMDKLARNHSDITGLATGFPDLDKYTSGFQPSDLIVIAARPAMGKTSFVLDVARNVALGSDKVVALFSLEMSKLQIAQRLLSSEAMVQSQRLRSPARLSDRESQQLVAATGKLSKARIFIDDTANITIMEIRAKARRLISRENVGLIIVDYMQLIQGSGRSESRQQEISEISRALKILGRELEVPVIAVSQLSRAVENRTEDRRPRLSDLRESGAIEQDADLVIFIYRDERYNPDSEDKGKAEIIIGKHRNGPTGTVKLNFLENYAKFGNLETRYNE
ncbi:MAG: replicative DNA helicase [Actinomycetota bacterium]|nr:replicative DNA helicase [Actinomycetota bacterium]